jgi:hypothetical protein
MPNAFSKLQETQGSSLRIPYVTQLDLMSRYGNLFSSNIKNIISGKIINKNKPFYGYVVADPIRLSTETAYLHDDKLNVATLIESPAESINFYPIRIPYLHDNTIPDPNTAEDEVKRKVLINCHTFCSVDPTRVMPNLIASIGTLVKVQFLDNDFTKGKIIGIANGTGGGFLGQIGAAGAVLSGPIGPGGNTPANAAYLQEKCTKDNATLNIEPVGKSRQAVAIAIGASMFNTHAPLMRELRKRKVDIDVSSNHDKIANCFLKLQLGGTQITFVEEQMLKIMQYPQEKAKYNGYRYIFINAPSGNDTAANIRRKTAEFKNDQQRIATYKRNLKTIFPNAIAMFLVKPSYGWGNISKNTRESTERFMHEGGFGNYFYILKADVSGDHHVRSDVIQDVATYIEKIVKTGSWDGLVFEWSQY